MKRNDVPTIIMTHNRQPSTLDRCITSLDKYVLGHILFAIVDDSGNADWRAEIADRYGVPVVPVGPTPRGYAEAMSTVWELGRLKEVIFLVEDDFVFTRSVDVRDLSATLRNDVMIAQLVLLRQPWFGNEVAAGGLLPALEQMGHALRKRKGTYGEWIEHRATWSSNPTVMRGGLWMEQHPWPTGDGSEYRFGQQLFANASAAVCGYWGDGSEYVEHIGQRTGFGY